jgi:hypothetical protein
VNAEADELREDVERLLDDLELSWSVDESHDWAIESEVGTTHADVREGSLVIVQLLMQVDVDPPRIGELFRRLLEMNDTAPGTPLATFAIVREVDPAAPYLAIVTAIPAEMLNTQSLALNLESVVRLWRAFADLVIA